MMRSAATLLALGLWANFGVGFAWAGREVGSSSVRLELNERGEVVRRVTRGGVELGGHSLQLLDRWARTRTARTNGPT